jgi:HSP20 family protein
VRDLHVYFPDPDDIAEDLRSLFHDLDRARRTGCPAVGKCIPDLDLFENSERYELRLDIPGVAPDSVRVLIKASVVIVAGEKLPHNPSPPRGAAFHLAERRFGRFARAVRLNAAFDGAHAEARYRLGELQILIPKIVERRGRDLAVPIRSDP